MSLRGPISGSTVVVPASLRRCTLPSASPVKYSIFSILSQAFQGQKGWPPAWRDASPKPTYDAVVVGGGGHGLSTAYYLAKNHGLTNVAVVEKGWIGSGNVGRNTTIIRSNYREHGNIPFYEKSLAALGGSRAGHQLQRHGEPARRAQPRSIPTPSGMRSPGAATPCGSTASMPNCWTAPAFRRLVPRSRLRQRPVPDRRWPACRSGAARCGMMPWPGAMPEPPTGAASTSCRTAKSPASGSPTATSPGSRRREGLHQEPSKVGLACAGNSSRVAAHGWTASADRKPRPASFRVRRHQAAHSQCVITFGAGSLLYQPIRQGRPRLRRIDRRL